MVDDTPANLRLLTELLTQHDYHVRPASDGALALKSVAAKSPDLILLDVNMPGMDGYEVCRRLKADEKSSRIPVIFISAFGDTRQKVTGFEAGGIDYITKPFEAEEVLARVRTHLRLRQAEEALRNAQSTLELRVQERTAELQASNQALRESEEKLAGHLRKSRCSSPNSNCTTPICRRRWWRPKLSATWSARARPCGTSSARLISSRPLKLRCSILGETGTGKELVAREIHQRSRRKDKPLVRVNCASIPKICSKANFSATCAALLPAPQRPRRPFETAEGGTIFLDEIGEVPLDLQSKLLRVLQEKRYERVGEDRTRQADVRIIAATNRDLKTPGGRGTFSRRPLLPAQCVSIQVLPLRERMEDIPLLAKHFC